MPSQPRTNTPAIRAFSPLAIWEKVALFAFMASLPVWTPILGLTACFGGPAHIVPGTPQDKMLVPMALSAMACALALLFVCLLKTAHAHLDKRLVGAMGAAYVLGLVLRALVRAGFSPASVSATTPGIIVGLLLGFSSVVLFARWTLRLRWSDARRSLAGVTALCAVAIAVRIALMVFVSPTSTCWVLVALGTVGVAGSLFSFARSERTPTAQAPSDRPVEEANWWDIFGKLDTSLILDGEEFTAPATRAIFFIAIPILMGMLWITNCIMVPAEQGAPFALIGTALACACAFPLIATRSDRALLNIGFRMLLPLVALITLACGTFVPEPARMQATSMGIRTYCTLYALLLGGLVFSMPGRMKSLALPCASIVTIVVNLVILLVSSPPESNIATLAQPLLAAVSLVGSAWLLLATLGGRMWASMMDLIPLEEAHAQEQTAAAAERSERLAREFGLTERESQVLPLLTRGHGAAYIADQLSISESTVRTHRTNIYRKLGVTCREELIALVDAEKD